MLLSSFVLYVYLFSHYYYENHASIVFVSNPPFNPLVKNCLYPSTHAAVDDVFYPAVMNKYVCIHTSNLPHVAPTYRCPFQTSTFDKTNSA